MKPSDPDILANLVLWAAVVVLALLFLVATGCATPAVRLNQGECLVMVEGQQIVTVGQDCTVKRFHR